MLSTFLIMGGRICTLDAFGVSSLLDSPGTKKHICSLVELLKAYKYMSRWKQLGYLVLEYNWITLVVVVLPQAMTEREDHAIKI